MKNNFSKKELDLILDALDMYDITIMPDKKTEKNKKYIKWYNKTIKKNKKIKNKIINILRL